MTDLLPLTPIGGVDDLLERARRGAQAGAALDIVKERLTGIRDKMYRDLLNAPADKVVPMRDSLKAMEVLAQSLLKEEAQGDLAYATLMESAGGQAPVTEEPFRPARISKKRASRTKRAAVK